MMRTLLTLFFLVALVPAWAQQVVFSEHFEGLQPAFTLNTPDVGAVESGDNTWLVNNAYAGGAGTLQCFGIPFSFTIPATAAQPAGISNANGRYLHITSAAAINSGILNCNFAAADGLCANEASHFARMAVDVSTVGATEATLGFWWLCAGGVNCFGELYFSTDNGTSWALVSTPVASYMGQATWVYQSVSLPEFAGRPALRFGFRFVNGTSTAASDPAFGIDDVSITTTTAAQGLTIGALAASSLCPGSSLDVPYDATGTWDTGNIFTAELSDADGSFGAPAAIGSITAVTSGTIAATIPSSAPIGAGYLIRVVGSNPATISANTVAVTLLAAPYAGESHHVSFCRAQPPFPLLNELPGASACGTWTAPDGSAFSGTLDPSTATNGGYTYVTNCPGNCPQDQAVLVVGMVQPPDAGDSTAVLVCINDPAFALFNLLAGTPDAGGTWSFTQAPHGPLFVPGVDPEGCYWYTVVGVNPCQPASVSVCITVDNCTAVDEVAAGRGLHWLGQQGQQQRIAVGGGGPYQVQVFDVAGRPMLVSARKEGPLLTLDMAEAASGLYTVRLVANGSIATVRLLHQR